LFSRSDKSTTNFNYLYSMPVLGGNPRQLGRDIDTPPAFSPDGKQMAYLRGNPPKAELELLLANVDGSGEKVLKTFPDWVITLLPISWSPDGKTILVTRDTLKSNELRWHLTGVSPSDGSTRELHTSEFSIGVATWLPDSKGLLFVGRDSVAGKNQLWSLNVGNGEVRRFTNDLSRYDGGSLELTRDGKSLVAVQVTQEASVYIAPDGDAARAKQLTSGESNGFSITWTPDGRLVTVNDRSQMVLMDAAGQQSTIIDEGPADSPSVCGDGKNVLFDKRRGEFGIWRVSLDGGGATLVAPGGLAPSCSPDGKWFTFYSGKGISRMPVEGGPAKVLVENTGGTVGSLISPDGRFVAYLFQEQEGNVFLIKSGLIPADGGALLSKSIVPFGAGGGQFAQDGKGIYGVLHREGAGNVWYLPLEGGAPRQITHFPSGQMFSFFFSKDGKQLAVGRGNTRSDVVRISNFR